MIDKLVGPLLLTVGILLVVYFALAACQCSYCNVLECLYRTIRFW